MCECISFFLPWVHSFPQILRGTQNSKKVKNYWLGAKYRSWGGCQSLQQRAVAPTFTDLFDLTTLVIRRSERLSQVGLSQKYQQRTWPSPVLPVGLVLKSHFQPSDGYISSQAVALGKTIFSHQLSLENSSQGHTLFWALLLLCQWWFFLLPLWTCLDHQNKHWFRGPGWKTFFSGNMNELTLILSWMPMPMEKSLSSFQNIQSLWEWFHSPFKSFVSLPYIMSPCWPNYSCNCVGFPNKLLKKSFLPSVFLIFSILQLPFSSMQPSLAEKKWKY